MAGAATGRGTASDKLEGLAPNVRRLHPIEARAWYQSNGFIQTIVDGPAEDAVREWITVSTNRDEDDTEAGLEGLGISRMIENRMDELGIREKIKDLIRFSRLYSEGGFLYTNVLSEVPQTSAVLVESLPSQFDRIDYINVFGPDYVAIRDIRTNPLSKYYHRRQYMVSGVDVHESRLRHLVRNYIPEEQRGISVIETILDAVKGQDTALWSVTTLVYEMSAWIFKSPDVKEASPAKLAEMLANMRAVISTQSCLAITDEEEIQRISGTEAGKGFLKEMFDFIFENLSGTSRMPKSRLMGQSQGVITAGQFDLLAYYDTIAKFQEIEIRPILYWIIDMIIREKSGKIWQALGGNIASLDWEIVFNPLWKLGPVEQADVELKQSQGDQIYITQGVLSPSEVKVKRFEDLEEFDQWQNQPLDFKSPAFKTPDDPEKKPGETANEKTGLSGKNHAL
jgi:phage-related protein (TIGR01555 family)